MTHEELDEFVNLLRSKGWTVVLRDNQLPLNLGDEVTNRYPNIPSDYLDFLKYVSEAYNADGTVCFLCENDYNGTFDGWPWNYFESLGMEAGEMWGPEELKSIKAFWDRYFPFMFSVGGDHAYQAFDLSQDDYGATVDAYSPDIDGISKNSGSFSEFIRLFGDELINEPEERNFPDFTWTPK